MATITLYHGSQHIIRRPVYHGGRPHNDYGHGFYCTESREMAKEWAVTEAHDGYANEYELDLTGLAVLDLNKEYGILTWLAVLMQNRTFNIDTPLGREAFQYLKETFSIDTSPYDAIRGYRADDSYFSFAQDFINGAISYQQLRMAMYLGEMGEQFVIVGREAFAKIQFKGCEAAMRRDWLVRKLERDRKARTEYLSSDRFRYQRGGLYVSAIIDEEMRPGDKRLI